MFQCRVGFILFPVKKVKKPCCCEAGATHSLANLRTCFLGGDNCKYSQLTYHLEYKNKNNCRLKGQMSAHSAKSLSLHLLLLHGCQPLEKMVALQPAWSCIDSLSSFKRGGGVPTPTPPPPTPSHQRGSWPHRLHGGPVRPRCGVPLVQRLVALHWAANQHPRSVLTLWINPLCSADMPSGS